MKSKSKVLFVMTNLNTGGVAISLVNLLTEIVKDNRLDISVLLFDDERKYKLPEGVRCLKSNQFLRILTVPQKKVMQESKLLGSIRLAIGVWTKLFGNVLPYKILISSYGCDENFDCAISFSQSAPNKSLYGGCNEVVLNRINAKTKISFLHCDYKGYKLNTPYSSKIYSKFDLIAAVSVGVKKAFVDCEPALSDRVFVVHNCHQFDRIRELANQSAVLYKNGLLNFVTVARLAVEKGHTRTIEVLSQLKKEGFDFVWHIVGGADVEMETEFKSFIDDNNLHDNVVMHGDQANPYRYMKNADFLLLPSFHEAAPMVFAEAQCLGVPIVTTRTISAQEFVGDKDIGYVCDNSREGIYDILKKIFKNPAMIREKKKLFPCLDNTIALNEFYNLIGKEAIQ